MDHQEWLEQHGRMIADHEMRHDRDMAEIRNTLRIAIRLSVQDARRQRKRNQEFDEKLNQIASAQLRNEESLNKFLERGGDGKH